MTIYKVRLHRSAMRDMYELEEYLKSVMSQIGANKYIDTMIAEVMSLSVFADLYRPSTKSEYKRGYITIPSTSPTHGEPQQALGLYFPHRGRDGHSRPHPPCETHHKISPKSRLTLTLT